MNDDRGPSQDDAESKSVSNVTDEGQTVNQSRRKLTTAGLIAVPLIMTLSSKSALGMNYRCTVSGMISGNLSHPGDIGDCMGRTPGFWCGGNFFAAGTPKTYTGGWPAPLLPTTPFHTSFGGVFEGNTFIHFVNNQSASHTLEEVMRLNGTHDHYQLGAHTVAALLNAKAAELGVNPFGGGREFGLTPNQVITLYNTYYASKPLELKTLFEIWNQDNATTRLSYQTAISQFGITIPNP